VRFDDVATPRFEFLAHGTFVAVGGDIRRQHRQPCFATRQHGGGEVHELRDVVVRTDGFVRDDVDVLRIGGRGFQRAQTPPEWRRQPRLAAPQRGEAANVEALDAPSRQAD